MSFTPSFPQQPKLSCQQRVLLEHEKLQKCQRDLEQALAVAASLEKKVELCEAKLSASRSSLRTRGAGLADMMEKLDDLQEDLEFSQVSTRKSE